MNRGLRYLVRASGDRDRLLMISGLILGVICLALYINLTILLSKSSSDETPERLINETNETTIVNQTERLTKYSLPVPMQYENFGHSLENYLYYDLQQFCRTPGYVTYVDLRLFSEWTGNTSLYLFIVAANRNVYEISYRYAIDPERNTTEWQTINIPSHALPIHLGGLVAIGMHESSSSRNQIYAVKSPIGMRAMNINENTTTVTVISDFSTGVAFSYTVMHNV